MERDADYPIEAPGWQAIDRACLAAHPGATPHQFTSQSAYDLQGEAPLPAITVWEGRAPAHWHYVTYGLSELFEKSSANPKLSGFGYELTFRLPRADTGGESADGPPTWPLQLLQGVAHYVMSGHADLDTGHVIDLGGPIDAGMSAGSTALEGLICVPDPGMPELTTAFGSVLFLALVGLTRDEFEPMVDWDMPRKVGLVREALPTALNDLRRPSWRSDPRKSTIYRRYELKVLL